MPASLRAGRPYNNDATALSTGDIQIPIVVADDMIIVEHPGNAERPHAAANRPTTSPHQPGLFKVTHLRFDCKRGTRRQESLDGRHHTGNAPKNVRSERAAEGAAVHGRV